MKARAGTLRAALEALYLGAGVVAALFLIAILCIIVVQMLARWTGFVVPGSTSYAGYCMAAASFFAFANALNRGSHIRVSILLNAVSARMRRLLEAWCFTIGTALAWYFVWYAVKTTWWSYKFHDISQGQDATPIWIPQMAMVVGSIIFAIALTDHLVQIVLVGSHRIRSDVVQQSHGD